MPIRPRPHQLEEISRRRFRESIPPAWVVRDKSDDYGIDVEVEIFENSKATGLIFYVQLKATDDSSKKQKVSIKSSTLVYFRNLDIKTIIARYCSNDDTIFWRWSDHIPETQNEKRSLTLHFRDDDQWDSDSPEQIKDALTHWRRVKNHPVNAPVSISLELDDLAASKRQPFVAMCRQIVSESNALTLSQTSENVSITLNASDAAIRLSIGNIASMEIDHTINASNAETQNTLRYMLATALCRAGLAIQADQMAKKCLVIGKPHRSEELAGWAARALTSSAIQSAELAILNGLENDSGISSILVQHHLRSGVFDPEDAKAATLAFLRATLKSAQGNGRASSIGAANYSLGNHFSNAHQWLPALSYFNKARKARPAYSSSYYFLSEVAGVLFGAARFALSAKIYNQAILIKPSPRRWMYLGDSQFFSGQLLLARSSFDNAIVENETATAAEALLKLLVVDWFIDRSGAVVVRKQSEVQFTNYEDFEETEAILSTDPLNATANWNAATHLSRNSNYADALYRFLLCAFLRSGDEEAWTNSLLCAINVTNPEMFQAVLKCALALGGPDIANEFCNRLSRDEQISESLSNLIMEFCTELELDTEPSFIFRVLGGAD